MDWRSVTYQCVQEYLRLLPSYQSRIREQLLQIVAIRSWEQVREKAIDLFREIDVPIEFLLVGENEKKSENIDLLGAYFKEIMK